MIKLTTLFSLAMAGWGFAETTRVWVGTGGDGIYTTELDMETGKMTGTKRAAEVKGAGFLAMRGDGKMLYATAKLDSGKAGVKGYVIEDGGLRELGEASYDGGGLCHVSLDETERVLLGADYGGGRVASFKIDESGAPGEVVSENKHEGSSVDESRQKGPHAHSFYAGPGNRFAYAPDLGIDKVMIYKLDAGAGSVKEAGHAELPPGSGPRHMKFGKDGKQAFVLNELTLTVSVLDRDPESGKLTLKDSVSVLPRDADPEDMTCSEIRISRDGKFAYTANRDLSERKRDSVSVMEIGEGGALKRLQTIGAELHIPRNLNLDPSGKWLLVAGQNSNEVTSFEIDPESGLLEFSGHRTPVPAAMCIEFER